MKARVFAWIIIVGLTVICCGQDDDEQKRYDEAWAKSEERAIAAYPDAAKLDSPLARKIADIDKALKAADEPLFYDPNKPYLLAKRAAEELGVALAAAKPDMLKSAVKIGEVIPELNEYRNVTIRAIEPDGIRIMHESGAAKIPIERLSPAQREAFGLSAEGATAYRRQQSQAAAAFHAREQQARWQREQAALQAQQEQKVAASPQQVSVWKMFVKNKDFQERHADEIAAEIELVQGREAAVRFRQKVEADRAAKAASAKDNERVSPSAIYQRSGARITINGDLSTGYNVRGNQLVDHATGMPTHMRGAGCWVPLNDSHPTIYDPP
jgi:hypothetical protein